MRKNLLNTLQTPIQIFDLKIHNFHRLCQIQ